MLGKLERGNTVKLNTGAKAAYVGCWYSLEYMEKRYFFNIGGEDSYTVIHFDSAGKKGQDGTEVAEILTKKGGA